jgi:hypothetical protein
VLSQDFVRAGNARYFTKPRTRFALPEPLARERIAPVISLETLVVAILSGLGGGLLGTWLQIRHERDEAFRERLITAADDLSTGLLQAIIGLDAASSACIKHGFLNAQNQVSIRHPETGEVPSEIEAAVERARSLVGEARARQARISLLFGLVSAPDRSTDLAFMYLDSALLALDAWPVYNLEEYLEARSEAKKYLRRVQRARPGRDSGPSLVRRPADRQMGSAAVAPPPATPAAGWMSEQRSERCVECGRKPRNDEHGWRAYLTDDEEEPAAAIVLYPECAAREFGARGSVGEPD